MRNYEKLTLNVKRSRACVNYDGSSTSDTHRTSKIGTSMPYLVGEDKGEEICDMNFDARVL